MAKANLLVVEDEFITAMDLEERLEELGYNVLKIVSSGEDAIKFAAELRPDLVLMDIVLQGDISGTKAAEKINSLEIPVIFLTAYSDDKTLENAKKSSPYGYIVKPYDDQVLKVTIESALKKYASDQKEMNLVKQRAIEEPQKKETKNWKNKKDESGSKSLENNKTKLMIVEDEFITSMDLNDKLEEMGYNVVTMAASGYHAIERAKEFSPDVVLMDIVLQGDIDGIEAADQIGQLGIPVIFLSAHSDKETLESALKTAPYGYIIKPFDEDKLHSTVEMALEKKRSEKDKYEKLGAKISSKQDELKMEKTGVFFVSSIFISLAAYGFIIRDMTWLAYLLFIPACYNIFLCIISLKKQEKPVEFNAPPMVSILIPAHNEEHTIERCVISLSEMDYYFNGERNFEIIVINDGSTDNTGKVLESLKSKVDCLRIVTRRPPRSGKGKGYVLNDGVKMARGEAIAVFDADSRVDSNFLKKIIPYLNEDKVVGVQSRVRMYNKDRNLLTAMQEAEFAIFGNVILRSRDIMGKNGFLGGNGQITTRKVMEEIEGWDGFAVTEDLNLSIKLMLKGYKIRYCSEAEVWQEAVPFWRPFFRQRVRWATGNLETLFVYLAPIIDADIPIYKKIDSIQYLFFLLFIAFVMLGYVVVILDFALIYAIKVNIPLAIGLLSTAAFFPGAILGIYRDKDRGIFSAVLTSIKYWAYCLYLIPLFFASFLHMITRKDRTWAKTDHSGDEE